uniref:G_PROTEIN_RECEP_F1_2 domain-containing protein n=1 Tax=Macrostomum lignano TaxID=282301 RepID=A0A1I8J1Y7_9PLAT
MDSTDLIADNKTNGTDDSDRASFYLLSAFRLLLYSNNIMAGIGVVINFVNYRVFCHSPVRKHYLSRVLRLLSLNDMMLQLIYLVTATTTLHDSNLFSCYVITYSYSLLTFLSAWLLVGISLDRFMCIILPATYTPRIGSEKAYRLVIIFLALGLAWSIHVFLLVDYRVVTEMEPDRKYCRIQTSKMTWHALDS